MLNALHPKSLSFVLILSLVGSLLLGACEGGQITIIPGDGDGDGGGDQGTFLNNQFLFILILIMILFVAMIAVLR